MCTNIFFINRYDQHRLHSDTKILHHRFRICCKNTNRKVCHNSINWFHIQGPSVRFWYGVMDKSIKVKSPLHRTLIKVGIDQIIFAPIFIALLVSTISYMQDQNVQLIEEKLRTQYKDILIGNYYVWPWVQLVNFRFVPLNYQVLLTQIVAFFWNSYISWKTHTHSVESWWESFFLNFIVTIKVIQRKVELWMFLVRMEVFRLSKMRPLRTGLNYRQYNESDTFVLVLEKRVCTLRFIRRRMGITSENNWKNSDNKNTVTIETHPMTINS